MIRAVLFDCDGVLVDSEPVAFAMLEQDLAAAGLPLSAAQMQTMFLGGTIRGLWGQARAMGADLPDGWVEDFYERLYVKLAAGTPLMPGIEALLDRLDAAGVAYAVGSNGTFRKMEVTLGQHPAMWARLQGRLASGQAMGRPKPDPAVWLAAAALAGAAPAECVVVDDSPPGCRGARAAGMRCFGLTHGDPAPLVAEGAEPLARLADLPGLIGV